ncbi:hypothetical protein NLJ89_g5218 [Agrocybe chaxingu]|uniref:Uncharacterized protein n=1 Tax=Agrocybe chaxingu TaxID=84603 RepID=A0A9W8K0M4_9AGAR|nr:hypothetical protein NLJ89_g5218 [Agrocybe chaxingu]
MPIETKPVNSMWAFFVGPPKKPKVVPTPVVEEGLVAMDVEAAVSQELQDEYADAYSEHALDFNALPVAEGIAFEERGDMYDRQAAMVLWTNEMRPSLRYTPGPNSGNAIVPSVPPSDPTPSSAAAPSSSSTDPNCQQAAQKGPLFKVHPSSFFMSPVFDYSIPDSKVTISSQSFPSKTHYFEHEATHIAKSCALTKAVRRTAKAEEQHYAKVQHELQVLAHAAEQGQSFTCLDPQNAYDFASATHAVLVSEQKMVKRRIAENELRNELLKDELKRINARVKAAEQQTSRLLETKEDLNEEDSKDSNSEMMEGSVQGSDSEDTEQSVLDS